MFLGVHKFAPNLSINADMDWIPHKICRHAEILRMWNHLVKMEDNRLTKKVFFWDKTMRRFSWCSDQTPTTVLYWILDSIYCLILDIRLQLLDTRLQLLPYTGYQIPTTALYWIPDSNCLILDTRLQLSYTGYQTPTTALYWIPDSNYCLILDTRLQLLPYTGYQTPTTAIYWIPDSIPVCYPGH